MKSASGFVRLPRVLVVSLGVACAISTSLATTRTVLTRHTPSGRVIVLDDGVEVANFDINPIHPLGIALTADGTVLYATDSSDATLSRIDVDLQNVTTIQTGEGARRVALNSTETRAYVTNLHDGSVSIVDTASFTVIQRAPLPRPMSVVVGPDDQQLYVTQDAIDGPDGLSKLSAYSGAVIDYIVLPSFSTPGDMAISHDGSELYISFETGFVLGRVDLESFTLTELVPTSHRRGAIVLHPSGSPMYVTSWDNHALFTVDPESFETLDVLDLVEFAAGADITPDGQLIYVHMVQGNTARVVDTVTNTVVDEIDVGGASRGYGHFIVERVPPEPVPAVGLGGAGLLVLLLLGFGARAVMRSSGEGPSEPLRRGARQTADS